jgi:hypothetical protein
MLPYVNPEPGLTATEAKVVPAEFNKYTVQLPVFPVKKYLPKAVTFSVPPLAGVLNPNPTNPV